MRALSCCDFVFDYGDTVIHKFFVTADDTVSDIQHDDLCARDRLVQGNVVMKGFSNQCRSRELGGNFFVGQLHIARLEFNWQGVIPSILSTHFTRTFGSFNLIAVWSVVASTRNAGRKATQL